MSLQGDAGMLGWLRAPRRQPTAPPLTTLPSPSTSPLHPPTPVLSQGEVVLVRQTDQPGIIAAVSTELAKAGVNISFMTVCRTAKGREAIMAIGVDGTPQPAVLAAIGGVTGVKECATFSEKTAA